MQQSPHSFNFVPSSVNAGNRRSPHVDDSDQDEMEPHNDETGDGLKVSSSFPHYSYNDDNDKTSGAHPKHATSSATAGAPDSQWGMPWIGGVASALSQPFSQPKENESQSGGFENLFSFGQGGKAKR